MALAAVPPPKRTATCVASHPLVVAGLCCRLSSIRREGAACAMVRRAQDPRADFAFVSRFAFITETNLIGRALRAIGGATLRFAPASQPRLRCQRSAGNPRVSLDGHDFIPCAIDAMRLRVTWRLAPKHDGPALSSRRPILPACCIEVLLEAAIRAACGSFKFRMSHMHLACPARGRVPNVPHRTDRMAKDSTRWVTTTRRLKRACRTSS